MFHTPSYWISLLCGAPIYWFAAEKMRPALLAALSFCFLAVTDPASVIYASMVSTAIFVLIQPGTSSETSNATRVTALNMLLLCMLALIKVIPNAWGFLPRIATGTIPIGISYYTFKLVHYAVERHRGKLPPHTLFDLLSYVLIFPAFTAGPIERFDHFCANRSRKLKRENLRAGLERLIHGFIKKYALLGPIASLLRALIPKVFWISSGRYPKLTALEFAPFRIQSHHIISFLFSQYLYSYLDFSAYTDLAIGSSLLFGIRLTENFNFPILARSPATFWRRWHATLGNWCRDYVYLPSLGLTRNPYLSVVLSFVVFGIWHACTMGRLLWGLYHGLIIAAVYLLKRRGQKVFRRQGFQHPAWRTLSPLFGWLFTQAAFALSFAFILPDPSDSLPMQLDTYRWLIRTLLGL